MVNDLKYYDGSLSAIERVPEDIKARFATAFEVDPRWLVEAAARRQKWIDQAQSVNLYMAEPSGKRLDNLYKTAWTRGLKTTYYLRSLGATHMEKNSEASKLSQKQSQPDNAQATANTTVAVATNNEDEFELNEPVEAPKFCSILDPDCEACQ